ncbi:MAG: nuclear transport factor 2 family protein [Actinomycetota bacterium]
MAHPNEESLRSGYEAFSRADVDAVMALYADDIRWHVPGRNQVSGDYIGKEQVGGFFMKLMELSGGTFRVDVHDVLANDEHAIGLVTLRGERDGKTLNANDVHVWHVRDGKFSEFWSHFHDLYAFDEFWS